MIAPRRIVVVGASLAGLCVVQEMRRLGFDGEVSLIGEESIAPYERPPLSKQVLTGEQGPVDVALADKAELATLGLDLRLGHPAVALDLAGRWVMLVGGERVGFDALVIATGAHARRPGFLGDLDGVHVLRTLSDALAIRSDLAGRENAVVVGAGFIGAEVAASLRTCGIRVTMVDPLPAPLAGAVGSTVGRYVAELHLRKGTALEMGSGVAALEGRGRVESVLLANGRRLPADLVVVGLGAVPATAWLEGSGLTIANGVVCDEGGSTEAPGVYAAGDVARWRHPLFDGHVRVEHWANARLQAGIVAQNLIAGGNLETLSTPPTFWSDQYDSRIQMIGMPAPSDRVLVVEGDLEQDRFVSLYVRDDRVTGALAVNSPRGLVTRQGLVAGAARWSEVEAVAR